jgi:NOL1/NOP2/sun family putative RNA methylase
MAEPLHVATTPALRRWAQAHGYSSELLARWASFYPDVAQLVAALEREPPRYLRLNPLVGEPRRTLELLQRKGFRLEPTGLQLAWRIAEAPFAPGATPEYLMGLYHLQDLSSQLAVEALEPAPGERVFDLAAAPGGKTIQIAQRMENTGSIHAFDPEPSRAQALRSNLARCGVLNAAVHVRKGQDTTALGLTADRVLLDAPCTGEGVIQRDPTRKRIQLDEYERCARDQAELLEAATRVLRPGGLLVYSTCTLAPEENELQVAHALETLPLKIEPLPPGVADLRPGGRPLTPGLTDVAGRRLSDAVALSRHTLPHLHDCLGFYLARFRRTEDT